MDARFNYEPMFFSHPTSSLKWASTFLKFKLDYPLWISSMTGGTQHAKKINENLARLCGEYKLGMGLGSCRPLLAGNERLGEFAVKKFMGAQPLFANIGMAQVEELLDRNKLCELAEMIRRLDADGLIIHLNPLQEWFQPEGDRFKQPPHKTLLRFFDQFKDTPVFIKEVGQGMGPRSIKALLELPIAGIELGAFGGTNFTLLESLRTSEDETKRPFIKVGHTAFEMVEILNALPTRNKEFIISGGIRNVLDAYELKTTLKANSLLGMAHAYLAPAMENYEKLEEHFLNLRESLLTAKGLLELKEQT
ncbi:MAG TPA: hypothetical protein VNJ01_05220 [Bacteriovoracaceae bacterium]|nr:hypothetical protein [Bacteriovoracaceae bacterium]